MRKPLIIRGFVTLAVLFAGLFGVVLAARPSYAEDTADLILEHGVFYPVQPPGKIEGSLAVRGGRIVYLGPDAGAAAFRGPKTRVIDLAGRAVTPGLIDAHSHLAGLGQALSQVDLTAAPTYRRDRPARARGRREGPRRHLGPGPGLGPEPLAGEGVPHPRRALRGGARPSRLAHPGGRPRRARQRQGDGDPEDRSRRPGPAGRPVHPGYGRPPDRRDGRQRHGHRRQDPRSGRGGGEAAARRRGPPLRGARPDHGDGHGGRRGAGGGLHGAARSGRAADPRRAVPGR